MRRWVACSIWLGGPLISQNQARSVASGLADGLRQRGQVLIIASDRKVVTDQFPSPWSSDAVGVVFAQIPAVRLCSSSKGTYDRGLIRVGIGQRGDGRLAATGTGASTKLTHARKSRPTLEPLAPQGRQCPVGCPRVRRMNPSRRADRRGRGMRGPLLPPETPRWSSRSEAFDQAVLDAYAPIEEQFHSRLTHLDIAVDTVPRMRLRPGDLLPPEIAADGPVALGRLIPAGVDRAGQPTRPRLVVFRRPIEQRASTATDTDELLTHVLTQLVAAHLNINPRDIDSTWDPETFG